MTQDFAKKTRRKTPRSPKKKSRPKSQTPGWVWLFTGTVLGAFIMFLAYLSGVQPQPETAPAKTKLATTPAKKAPQSVIPKPRFDFYQLLEEDKVKPVRTEPSRPKKPKKSPEQPIEYLMQVGSFKKPADADRLRAELLLMNLSAHVEEFKKRNRDLYYRVLVGPYNNRSQMSKDRSTLAGNKIDIWVITRKTDT